MGCPAKWKLMGPGPQGPRLAERQRTPSTTASAAGAGRGAVRTTPAPRRAATSVCGIWVWLKIKQGQTAGVGPCFHLPGQPILEFRFFEPRPYVFPGPPKQKKLRNLCIYSYTICQKLKIEHNQRYIYSYPFGFPTPKRVSSKKAMR